MLPRVPALVKIGISAWTERTLVSSGFYPPGARTAEARLRHYASSFPIVEVDATHYALLAEKNAELWSERTPEGFTMNVKVVAPLSEHYIDPRGLPRDMRDALPREVREKRRIYPQDLGDVFLDELAARFVSALRPLKTSGKLGLVLVQYPVWFTFSSASLRRLERTHALFRGHRLAIEFRNAGWLGERHRDETLAFLREQGLVYTCVDEPQGFASSVPPIAEATTDLALVRFHGRNVETWEKKSASAGERFAYEYEKAELASWVPKIVGMSRRTREVHVIMNNCYRDWSVRSAVDLTEMLRRAGARIAEPRAPLAA
ncbi:DUF72 domain-containing protein [Polyangium mundeleinium]|uniref:DUF72 domain-containing protein n=1 Tax=Polyangium mundeleinium TaxID=2995306 RepID=A0ABT5EMN1_9BACT|nr:DUF72 domain-containing protein [Polyangium mundeleinium]MDC0742734.1 DUF72 domain-containing protein [Polyangium mundeleinium]